MAAEFLNISISNYDKFSASEKAFYLPTVLLHVGAIMNVHAAVAVLDLHLVKSLDPTIPIS
jgi:hypothetical protein